jgi:tetratricopeptide (TPR) repeat protein
MELGVPERALECAVRLEEEGIYSPDVAAMKADCLIELKRYTEAVPILERLLTHTDKIQFAWLKLGWCHKRMDQLDLAIRDMEQLIKLDPQVALGHYNLACYLSLSGDHARCLEELRAAMASDPEYVERIAEEADFAPVRALPEFTAIVASARAAFEKQRREHKPDEG